MFFILPGPPSFCATSMPWYDSGANSIMFFKLLAPLPGERILDIGAGQGVLADSVRSRGRSEVYAADPDKARVAKMRRRFPSLWSCVASSEELPYPDAYFDKVYSTLALHHFTDQRRSIQEFSRVMKPKGVLLIVEIRPRSARGMLLRLFENGIMRSHLRFLEVNELAEQVGERGIFGDVITSVSSYVYFLWSRKGGRIAP